VSSVSEPIVASALAIAQVYALDADAGHALAPPPGYRFADITWKGAGEAGRLRTFGAGFEGDDALLLAFRGTADVSDLFADLRCEEAPFDGLFPSDPTPRFPVPLRGAEGFEAVYRSMHDALHAIIANARPARLHLAGHSLGAVLATYLCADLLLGAQADAPPITLTLWAPPKPGNASLAQMLRQQRDSGRVTANVLANVHDIVPKYPFSTDYVHPFTPSLLDFGNPFDVLGNHRLTHYLRAYEQGWAHRAPVASRHYEELRT
jgi:hypothetical protein